MLKELSVSEIDEDEVTMGKCFVSSFDNGVK